MISIRLLSLAAPAAAALLLASCAGTKSPPGDPHAAYVAYDRPASLPSDPSAVRVKVSLSKQRTYVMEGDKPLLVMPVSVGKPSSPTPRGHFRIGEKDHYHRANTHGYASNGSQVIQTYLRKKPAGWSFKGTPMPYWCSFKGGDSYGFHTGWVKHTPTTLGCIRMHENLAPKFYRLVRTGTPVHIAYSHPEDAKFGNIPLPPDAGPLPDYPAQFFWGNGYFTKHKTPTYR